MKTLLTLLLLFASSLACAQSFSTSTTVKTITPAECAAQQGVLNCHPAIIVTAGSTDPQVIGFVINIGYFDERGHPASGSMLVFAQPGGGVAAFLFADPTRIQLYSVVAVSLLANQISDPASVTIF